jgi:tungstate transport system substrate-binding protein
MRRLALVPWVLLAAAGGIAGSCGGEPGRVRLATTTSARDSGLLEWVLPEIERKAGIHVSVIAVGTGQALELARRGDADLVLVHDRAREDAFVKQGWGKDRRDLMWNDFVIVGPPEDPAGLRGGKDAAAALRRLAEARAAFVSRGDDSGTHSRERSLLAAAGVKPPWPGYVESGQGMGPTLLMAGERRAYTLTDRGTFASMSKRLPLAVVVEGDPALRNPYGVLLVDPAKVSGVNVTGARTLLEYLASPEGQARIGAFRVGGEQIFHPGAPPG